MAPFRIDEWFIWGSSTACLLGLAYLLLTPIAVQWLLVPTSKSASNPTSQPNDLSTFSLSSAPSSSSTILPAELSPLHSNASIPIPRSLLPLLMAQGLFLFLSWLFFYTMEFQTHFNARVQPLPAGTLIGLIKAKPWTLGFCPWLCFAVCGVGLAYLSICLQRTPTLPNALFPEHRRHPSLFFHNYCQIIVDTVLLGPPIFLFGLTTIWFAESLSISFGWSSLFLYPWKTTISFLLIILVFRKSHHKLLDHLLQRKTPLGGVLALYAMGIAIFLFWVHSFGSWFTFGIEATDPNTVLKSPLAGSFSEEALTHRLELLIWGWWAIWVPHFASLIARLSIGRSVFTACLQAIILPAAVFLILIPRQENAFLTALFPAELSVTKYWLITGFLMFALMLIFGQTRNTADIQRMAMPEGIGKRLRARPLHKWFMSMVAIFICYMTGEYILGWVPSQVIVTLGAIFMMTVVFIFLGVLFSTKVRFEDAKKYKVPTES